MLDIQCTNSKARIRYFGHGQYQVTAPDGGVRWTTAAEIPTDGELSAMSESAFASLCRRIVERET